MLGKLINQYRQRRDARIIEKRLKHYLAGNREPWSEGYAEYKASQIMTVISDSALLQQVREGKLPKGFGHRLDERIVEYVWIFAHLKNTSTRFLDAGSTFNFEYLVNHPLIASKESYIYTYYPENPSFPEKRISYIYGDLRSLPFKDNFFEEVVCQSTIEHVDMDNSIYGYDLPAQHKPQEKSYDYLKVIAEIVRVTQASGQLLLTFPYGKFENHGFFQQFDAEMVSKITTLFEQAGSYKTTFFQYKPQGWEFATQETCKEAESYNPHTGMGKKDDGAAHSRAICCLQFIKNA
jgi:hypothetical protein